MSITRSARFVTWCAFISAAMTIIGVVTLFVFFALGQPWGTINDLTSITLALSGIPVVLTLYRLYRTYALGVSVIAVVIGVIALLTAAALQTLLVLKTIPYEQTAVNVPAAFGVFGLSLLIFAVLSRADQVQPRALTVWGIIAGIGYIVVIIGILIGGQEHPLASIGGLLAVVGYPVWAVWFGRLLLSGRIMEPSNSL